MKIHLILAVSIITLQACSKKQNEGKQEKIFSNGSKFSVEQEPRSDANNFGIRERAKLTLQRAELNTSEQIDKNVEILQQFTRELEIEEQLSHAEAFNELFIDLTNNQPADSPLNVRIVFIRAFLSDSEGIASLMGELPAGEMRRLGVALIRGKGLVPEQLTKIYQAMPESADRSDIADEIVAQTLFAKGVDSALGFVQSLTSVFERENALKVLASSMATANQGSRNAMTSTDVEKVKAYAKSIGQDYPVRTLDRIQASK